MVLQQIIMFWLWVEFWAYNHASTLDTGEYYIHNKHVRFVESAKKLEQISVLEPNLSESITLGQDHQFQVLYS